MHDPRYTPGLTISYRMDATPARHTQGFEMLVPPGLDVDKGEKHDYAGKGEVRPQQLATRYDVSRHPGVLAAALSEEEAAIALLWPWEKDVENKVSLEDFAERYEWVSPYVESDALFENMMRTAWHLKD